VSKYETKEFSPYVIEQIGWYVYALQDPRDNKVFYVGKGQGNRVFAHSRDAIASDEGETSQKIGLIKEIHNAGKSVNSFILRHGISDEKVAYEIESALIDLLYLLDPKADNELFLISNMVKGHHHLTHGSMSTQNIMAIYDATECPEIEHAVLLFKIPVRWFPQMTDEQLFESTHGWWRLGERRNGAKYALAVSAGVVRGIYSIDSWRVRKEGDRGYVKGEKPRFGFDGNQTNELDIYMNKSVRHLFKKGEQTPFKYLNC
jgi:hypothetical protein